jgi:hypothetical protein
MYTVVVATPSRGLVHSRTIDAVQRAIQTAIDAGMCQPVSAGWWVLTHDLPIPQCHEQVAELALETGADLVWFVEEDVVPPQNALTVMIAAMTRRNASGAFVDYPIGANPTYNCAMRWRDGTAIWCGTGCLLVKSDVFKQLTKPWFPNEHEVEITVIGEQIRLREFDKAYEYGGQDIWFTVKMRQAGMRIAYVPPEVAFAEHLELETWGEKHKNRGSHCVRTKPNPEKWC